MTGECSLGMEAREMLMTRIVVVATVIVVVGLVSSTPVAAESQARFVDALARGLESSDDPSYGYDPSNPIKIGGGFRHLLGMRFQRLYLDALRGPKGKKVKYERLGPGGEYPTDSTDTGFGIIDKFEIRSKGLDGPQFLYITIYDYEHVRIPLGLSMDHDHAMRLLQDTILSAPGARPN